MDEDPATPRAQMRIAGGGPNEEGASKSDADARERAFRNGGGGGGAPGGVTSDNGGGGDEGDGEKEVGGGFFCCVGEVAVETEWRTVGLRFGTDTLPAPSQKGSRDNAVFTAKYTFWSFLPKGIFEQFRRIANVYFLGISVMMAVGTYVPGTWYSSLDPWTTILPLGLIVGLTLLKEGAEDRKRHKADHQVNNRMAEVLCPGSSHESTFKSVPWKDLQPGMVLRIKDRGEFPADLVPLASSEQGGKCYVETANIDGETNLKLRTAAMGDKGFSGGKEILAAGSVSVSFEPPNASIHSFNATLDTGKANKGKAALDAQHLLLRGAVLRNTKWILGVLVYTGSETKLVMNSREAPSKLSTVEQMVNEMIYFILGAMVVLTSLTLMGHAIWDSHNGDDLWYLCKTLSRSGVDPVFKENCDKASWSDYPLWTMWPTFFILYNNFLPISLYVTMEIVNVCQAYFVDTDVTMYHEEQDTPALARTSNMNGDCGQIEYVFSDKTGTLTCNEMKFRRCAVGGTIFGETIDKAKLKAQGGQGSPSLATLKTLVAQGPSACGPVEGGQVKNLNCAHHFGTLLALCHNVVVEEGQYLAESPDEEALVDGAVSMGLRFVGQTGDALTVEEVFDGDDEDDDDEDPKTLRTYTLLATVPFSSLRKRMSVLVKVTTTTNKTTSDECWLYTKGADNVMFDRTLGFEHTKADRGGGGQATGFDSHCGGFKKLNEVLEVFAAEGLRTLVLGYRKLSVADALKWQAQWKAATESRDRHKAMEAAAASLERDLVLLGCTGLEDRLQEGVPEAIAHLKKAGIKVWVLTGDKLTTAVEIGKSCKLLTPDLQLVTLEHSPQQAEGDTATAVAAPVTERLRQAHAKHCKAKRHRSTSNSACSSQPSSSSRTPAALSPPPSSLSSSPSSSQASSDGGFAGVGGGDDGALTFGSGLGLVVDGPSLTDILGNDEYRELLLELACSCAAVVACRVSPAQKQLIVKMVKEGLPKKPITLSIGDGANDVPMIQEAQIGVGISGKEGRQAVNSSDFAIAQFRFLETLLLVHGRWNYRRIAKVVVYSFYKNIVLTIVLAWWTMDCGYSGQSLYESYVYAGYNFFLGMPILLLGIFDQDVMAGTALRFQGLYYVGRERTELNVQVMAKAFLQACVDAALVYYLTLGAFNGSTLAGSTGGGDALGRPSHPQSVWNGSSGESNGLYVFGTAVFTNMVLAMLLKVCVLHASWNWWSVGGLVFSVGLYFGFISLYGSFSPAGDSMTATYLASYDFYQAPSKMFEAGGFWASCAMVCAVVSMLDLSLIAVQTQFFTSKLHSAREWEYVAVRHSALSSASAVNMPGMSSSPASSSSSATDNNNRNGGGGGGSGGGAQREQPANKNRPAPAKARVARKAAAAAVNSPQSDERSKTEFGSL